jgi:hypothetical protein
MTEVFFSGKGDWYIKDSDGTRLAISRGFDKYRSISPEHMYCLDYPGFFRLTDTDEENYQCTKDISAIKLTINKLLPSFSQGSAFLKMVESGKLSVEDMGHCFFLIQREKREKKKYVEVPFNLTIVESEKPIKSEPTNNNPNKSNQLVMLNQASDRFWCNSDRSDKTTWPDTKAIVAWLQERDFSESLAKKAASIIRPEWAGSGRPPSE